MEKMRKLVRELRADAKRLVELTHARRIPRTCFLWINRLVPPASRWRCYLRAPGPQSRQASGSGRPYAASTGAGAPHAAQHLTHCAVPSVECCKLGHCKGALAVAPGARHRRPDRSRSARATDWRGWRRAVRGLGIGGSHYRNIKRTSEAVKSAAGSARKWLARPDRCGNYPTRVRQLRQFCLPEAIGSRHGEPATCSGCSERRRPIPARGCGNLSAQRQAVPSDDGPEGPGAKHPGPLRIALGWHGGWRFAQPWQGPPRPRSAC